MNPNNPKTKGPFTYAARCCAVRCCSLLSPATASLCVAARCSAALVKHMKRLYIHLYLPNWLQHKQRQAVTGNLTINT